MVEKKVKAVRRDSSNAQCFVISVIVPIYNIEEYISKCIDSILMQTYTAFEVLLVDDGSTDASGRICDKYAEKDTRIRVFHKENGGLSDARNYGLDRATGDIISFVDGDDYIHPQMMEIMIKTKEKTDAEVVACRFERSDPSILNVRYSADSVYAEVISGTEAIIDLNKPEVVAWNKIYDKEIFDDIRYPIGKYHEDEFVIHRIFHKCERIAILQEKLYFYVIRENSIMDEMTPKRVYDALEGLKNRCDYCDTNGWFEVLPAVVERYCEYCVSYYMQIKENKLLKMNEDIAEYLLRNEQDMIKTYRELNINERYRLFASSPEEYMTLEYRDRRRKKCRDMLLKYPKKIYKYITKYMNA